MQVPGNLLTTESLRVTAQDKSVVVCIRSKSSATVDITGLLHLYRAKARQVHAACGGPTKVRLSYLSSWSESRFNFSQDALIIGMILISSLSEVILLYVYVCRSNKHNQEITHVDAGKTLHCATPDSY